MDRQDLTRWVERYVRAWQTNDPAEIGALFTDDARYFTAPGREPWQGRDAIVAGWLDRKDEPETWRFRWEHVAIDGRLGIVRGWTRYTVPPTNYHNLWLVRLTGDQRCQEFTEWWMIEE